MEILDFIQNDDPWLENPFWRDVRTSSFIEGPMDHDALVDHFTSWQGIERGRRFPVDACSEASTIVRKAIRLVQEDFPQTDMSNFSIGLFALSPQNEFVAENMGGVSGFAFRHSAALMFSTALPGWQARLRRACVHEINHLIRQEFDGFYDTFLAWVVMEGMAEVYVSEKFPMEPASPWVHGVSVMEMKALFPRVREFWTSEDAFSRERVFDWFFGSVELGVPKWFGYALGFELVRQMRDSGENSPWCDFIRMHSSMFSDSAP